MTTRKVYLADGAYYEFDGRGVLLTAEDGLRATDEIYLEPETIEALLRALSHDFDSAALRRLVGGDEEELKPA